MKVGIHAYAWCSEWSNDTLFIIDKVKEYDLDFLEVPLMSLDKLDTRATLKRAKDAGVELVTSTVLLNDTDITSENPEIRQKGIKYLIDCVDATAALETDCFSGVIYSQYLKPTQKPPTEETWKLSAEALREVAQYAKGFGIELGLEPVTRYETYLINTSEQALKLIDMIGEDNVKVHLDTYHMNVEEKDFYNATKITRDKLIHFHLCENDRGIPGTGHVDWDGVFKALSENKYSGRVGLEGFSDVTDNMSTWVWRKLAPNGDVFLKEGLAFLRSMIKKYNL